jgi:hypothetical protein
VSRHDRRAQAAMDRKGMAVSQIVSGYKNVAGHNVLALVVSYHGAKIETIKNLFGLEHAAQDAGHSFAVNGVGRTPLDLARNETVTQLLASKATVGLFLDDDCQVDEKWLPIALSLLSEERGIITAPCRLRGEKTVFNIAPTSPPFEVNGVRLMECSWTGFGCVLISRGVLETMHTRFAKLHYHSHFVPGAMSCGMFRSDIAPRRLLDIAEGDPEGRMYVLDDHIWSLRARASGFRIHATIDVNTVHDGYAGNFGATLTAHEAAKASSP